MAVWPCTNPSCASNGRPHPNCHCPPPYAHGGVVKHFCATNQKHLSNCEYYAEGGNVELAASPSVDNPALTVGHVASSKGLLGILKDVGRSTIQDPDRHVRVLREAKDHHMVKKEFPDTPRPRTLGGKIGHHIANGEHEKAAEVISGHPLTGLVGKSHLKSTMGQLSGPMMSQEPHPSAFRGSVDYLSSASKGKDTLDKQVKNLFGNDKSVLKPDVKSRDELKSHLSAIAGNPNSLLELGGDLSHYLPDHSAQVTAISGNAVTYLNSLKPTNTQESPFDTVLEPSKTAISNYDRQVDLAQNPLLVLQHAKDGTLLPNDIATLQTIYPSLYKSIVDKIGEHIIDAKTKLPYKMRSSFSLLLGQPLDSTMTTQSMQAIIASAAPRAIQGPKKNAPATTLKAADKANAMLETPQQARLINKKQ